MSKHLSTKLEDYIKDILDGKEENMRLLSEEFKDQLLPLVRTLNLNPVTLESALETISSELFSNKNDNAKYVTIMLLFSIELDKFCRSKYSWYNRDTFITLLTKILNQKCFPSYTYKCSIL